MKRYQLFEINVEYTRNKYVPDPRCSMDTVYAGKERTARVIRIVAQDQKVAEAQAVVSLATDAEAQILEVKTSKVDYVINVDN